MKPNTFVRLKTVAIVEPRNARRNPEAAREAHDAWIDRFSAALGRHSSFRRVDCWCDTVNYANTPNAYFTQVVFDFGDAASAWADQQICDFVRECADQAGRMR